MNILVLGGTGAIGSEITKALIDRGYDVAALCRSSKSENIAEELGSKPLKGDITSPAKWAREIATFDAIIHVAATFDANMAQVDENLLTALFSHMSPEKKLIYTGGAWLFGDTAAPINEEARYNPPRGWDWMATGALRVLQRSNIWGMVIHPGNVVDSREGVPPILIQEAQRTNRVHIPLPKDATWPLVSKADLAELYCLALEKGMRSDSYMGASEAGVRLSDLGKRTASLLNLPDHMEIHPVQYWIERYGEWANGYGLSQKISSEKAFTSLGWKPQFKF